MDISLRASVSSTQFQKGREDGNPCGKSHHDILSGRATYALDPDRSKV